MTNIIHSRNLFIDTSTGSGKGDEFNLELGANQISAGDGQFLRATLVSFNMYNNISPVNETNNQFRVVSRYGPVSDVSQFLGISTVKSFTPKKYSSVSKLNPNDPCGGCSALLITGLPCPISGVHPGKIIHYPRLLEVIPPPQQVFAAARMLRAPTRTSWSDECRKARRAL